VTIRCPTNLQFHGIRRRVIPPAMRITEVTRRRLIQGLIDRRTDWSGQLDEVDFLGRPYDLDTLPSTDSRFRSARGDVRQHRVVNALDWDDDWIFSDPGSVSPTATTRCCGSLPRYCTPLCGPT
jgi:AbiJ N-terminal domain 3